MIVDKDDLGVTPPVVPTGAGTCLGHCSFGIDETTGQYAVRGVTTYNAATDVGVLAPLVCDDDGVHALIPDQYNCLDVPVCIGGAAVGTLAALPAFFSWTDPNGAVIRGMSTIAELAAAVDAFYGAILVQPVNSTASLRFSNPCGAFLPAPGACINVVAEAATWVCSHGDVRVAGNNDVEICVQGTWRSVSQAPATACTATINHASAKRQNYTATSQASHLPSSIGPFAPTGVPQSSAALSTPAGYTSNRTAPNATAWLVPVNVTDAATLTVSGTGSPNQSGTGNSSLVYLADATGALYPRTGIAGSWSGSNPGGGAYTPGSGQVTYDVSATGAAGTVYIYITALDGLNGVFDNFANLAVACT